jgi:VanZ family protein
MLRLLLTDVSGLPRFWWLQFPHSDKLVHATMFGVLSVLVLLAIWATSLKPLSVISIVALWAIALAVVTELVQHCCIPSRAGEAADLAADLIGAAIPILGYHLLGLRRPQVPDTR